MKQRIYDAKKYIRTALGCLILFSGHNLLAITVPGEFDSLAQQIESISFTEGTQARSLIEELYQIARTQKDSVGLKRRCLYYESELSYAQSTYDSTLMQKIQDELRILNPEKGNFDNALMHYCLSLSQITKGRYDEAFAYALYAMEHFKELKDSLFVARSLCALARTCSFIESFRMSEDYYNQALAYIVPFDWQYYYIHSNIFIIRGRSHLQGNAVDSLLLLTDIIKEKQFTGLLATNYAAIGALYYMREEYDEAFRYYMEAKNLNQIIDNQRFSISLYQNLGAYYLAVEDVPKAYQNINLAKTLALQSGNPDLIGRTMLALSYIYDRLQQVDSAYFYLRQYDRIRTEIMRSANSIEAYQSYISAFLEASRKELIIRDQEILLKNRRLTVVVILAISLILLTISWVIILQLQKKHSRQQALLKEAENKDLEERLSAKQQIEHLQEDRIAGQVRELTSNSLVIATKNSVLQQIDTAVQRLPDDKTAIGEIRQIIKNNLNVDKVWSDFVLHFEKVHPNFFTNLKSCNKDISENDLRLCAYFRIGMSTKEIAQLLNVSPEAVKKHRYRIKKKLGLAETQNLDDFIRNI